MGNTVIAMGGTGARCAEAIAHLAAMGAVPGGVRFLLVDLDQSNGNLSRTREVIERYKALGAHAGDSGALATPLELEIWKVPRNVALDPGAKLSFREAIGMPSAGEEVLRFLRLFFSESYDELDLSKGCFQHPEIGSLIMRRMLRESLADRSSGLWRTVQAMASELQSGNPVRVFAVGSVFGGTGASGLPYLPALFSGDELAESLPEFRTRGEQLRLGAAMVAPYFQWSGGGEAPESTEDHATTSQGNGAGPQVHRLAPHAKAILGHYARHPPGYKNIYVIGAPTLWLSCDRHADGGDEQLHRAHYVEWITALAALDFFGAEEQRGISFSYAESTVQHGDGDGRRQQGVNWSTLPIGGDSNKRQMHSRFLELTLLVLFLRSYLLPRLQEGRFGNYPWYEEGVGEPLPGEQYKLIQTSCDEYLRWLSQVLASISSVTETREDSDHPSLLGLRIEQLALVEPGESLEERAETLPSLALTGDRDLEVFHQLCAHMDRCHPKELIGTDSHATVLGRLLFFAKRAVSEVASSKMPAVRRVRVGQQAEAGSEVQSRYLPRVQWEERAFTPVGEFASGSQELLAQIGSGLVVGKAEEAHSNPISSPWAQAYLFETALRSEGASRRRAVQAWRGLMGILAFRQQLGTGRVLTEEVLDLEALAAEPANSAALGEFVSEARAESKEEWLRFHLLRLGGLPFAGSSPYTLVFPGPDLPKVLGSVAAIPWYDAARGRLLDPAAYFSKHAHRAAANNLRLLRQWLDALLDGSTPAPGLQRSQGQALIRRELEAWRDSVELANVPRAPEPLAPDGFFGLYSLPAINMTERVVS